MVEKKKKTRSTSSSVDPATQYALDVTTGKILAGPDIRNACARHLRDLENGPARGLTWDIESAQRGIDFFAKVLKLNGGEHEGKPFILLPWQCFIVGSIFGWKASDGYRRFRMVYVESGKGSGKSPLAGGVGLYCLVADKEPRAEVYAAATKKDQAMILFRDAVAMVDQSPALSQRIHKSGGTGKEWNLAFVQTGSFFRPISSDDGQSGPRPHCALIDEVIASSAAGVVTLTARHKGLSGNDIPVVLNYYGYGGGEVLPAGVAVAVAAGAAGTGAPVLNGAIAAMADEPFDYIGHPFSDLASVNAFVSEMNDTSGRWSYARQLYGHVYTAKLGTLSELVAAGDQLNQQHITVAGYEKETQTPADELAASRTARNAVFIRNDPARPTQTGELVDMLPAPKGKRFTMTEQQSLLSHGIATSYVESGTLRIQRDVTTYKKNAYGVADNSYLDSETLHTSAYVLRRLKSVITSKYGRHKLANDGTRFGPGQAIVTPAVIKGELLATYRQMERAGIVENYDLFKQYLKVERDATNPNRINTLFPPDYVNQLRVFAVVNQFRLQYQEESA